MSGADPFDGTTPADSKVYGDVTSATVGPGSLGSEAAGAAGKSEGRNLPTPPASASHEGSLDPADPDGFILKVNPPAEAGMSSPRGEQEPDRTAATRNLTALQSVDQPAVPTLARSEDRATLAPRERSIPAIAGYQILGELGRGGMGIVYRARQVLLNRPCALKMILAGAHADDDAAVRFLSEAEAVARLQHPNVVQIHHIGEADGLPFFELEYLDGGSLDRRLDGTPWPARRSAQLVEALARAIAEAHRLGIIHRDLKPSNILLAADGTPKITDFGLAKSLATDMGLTRTDSILGSPGYMAPEQAEGRTREVGPRADIYSLGAILYELLTGRPPFRAATVLQTLEQVKRAEPVPPSRLTADVPRDLETIALKCLAKEPMKRYESAQALAEDLRRFQSGESIQARRTSTLERTWRWGKRNPVVAGAVGSTAAALVAVAVLAMLYADRQARYARGHAEATTKITRLAEDLDQERRGLKLSLAESNHRLIVLNLERGRFACEQGTIGPGLLWMVESLRAATEAGDSSWQHAARANLSAWSRFYPKLRAVFSSGIVSSLAFSPDGKTVLIGTEDKAARLWDAASGQPVGQPLPHQGRVLAVAFSPDGRAVLTAGDDKTARLWDAATGQPIGQPLEHEGRVFAVAFSPDGKTVLTGSEDHTSRIWNIATCLPIGQPLVHQNSIRAVAFSPDGKTVLTGSEDTTARLWDIASRQPIGQPLGHRAGIFAAAFSPDGKTVLTGSEDTTARLWNAATGQPIGQPLSHHGRVFAVAFSPDGKTVLTGGEDKEARLWDAATERPLGQPLEHQDIIRAVAFNPDGKTVLTGGEDTTARLWDVTSGQPIGQPLEHPNSVLAVVFSPDGKTVLTGSEDHTARLWDAATARPIGQPLVHQNWVFAVAFSPDGRTVLTGSEDKTARLWDAATGQPFGQPLVHQNWVFAVAFSPDGRTVLTGSEDKTARLWDATLGQPLGQPLEHRGSVRGVAFNSKGRTVLTQTEDQTARLWDITSGQPIGQPLGLRCGIFAAAFSPDGKTVLTGSEDHTARLWDAATGRPIGQPLNHRGSVRAVAFSPDGKAVLTGSEDKTARLWDAATGRPLGESLHHHNWVLALAFSPDGKTILTGCLDSTARLWDAATSQPIGQPLGGHRFGVDAVAFSSDGKTILTKSQDGTARLWDAAGLPADLPRLANWVRVVTGLELDEGGALHVLDATAWRQRRERLNQQGGPPDSGSARLLDPILFSLDPTVRARSLMELGRGNEAEDAFCEAVALRPLKTSVRLERGRFYAARSQPEKAAADFARALELVPENRYWNSPRSQMILDLARWNQAFAKLLELREQDGHLWTGRGRYYALRSQWDRAAADYARGIASAPPDSEEWFEHVCLRWIVGDHEGYRNFVREMSEREGATNDPIVLYVLARSCNLSPEPVVELDQVIRWAEQAVTRAHTPWYLHALGVAHYRAGHFEEAIHRLEESIAGGWGEEGKAQNRLVLAMANQRLGHVAKARALLDEVFRWWNTVEAAKIDGAASLPATDWLARQIFRHEAEALILYDPIFPADPFAPN